MHGLGDRENRGVLSVFVSRGVVIVVIARRMIVAVIVVVVVADVEVEVEEAGADLSVPMPVAGGVQAEPADTDDDGHAENRASQPGTSDHGSPKASHLGILLDRAGQILQSDGIRSHDVR